MDLDGPIPNPTLIQVRINTTLHIPLHSRVLQPLDEAGAGPEMKEEIIKEAIRLSVSEKLGYFDNMDIRFKGMETVSRSESAPPRSEAVYEAALNLTALGKCVEAIQEAYNHIQQQALLLREVASVPPQGTEEQEGKEEEEDDESGDDKKASLLSLLDVVASRDDSIDARERAEALKVLRETLVAVGDITERMCALPSRITEAAAAAAAGTSATPANLRAGGEGGEEGGADTASQEEKEDTSADHIAEHERERRERREAKKRLLADESDDAEKDPTKGGQQGKEEEGDYNAAGGEYGPVDTKEYLYDDSDDEEEANYAKMGYTQL